MSILKSDDEVLDELHVFMASQELVRIEDLFTFLLLRVPATRVEEFLRMVKEKGMVERGLRKEGSFDGQ